LTAGPPLVLFARLQEFDHRLARLFGGRGIAADMRVEFDASLKLS
jgi:hypothetical protein